MKRYFKNFLLFFSLAVSFVSFAQQYPQYSGYMFNPFTINPAYAGNYSTFQATVVGRNQWVNLAEAPKTAQFAIHGALKNEKAAVGLNIYSDQIGFTKTTAALATYAYRIILAKSTISFGLRGGVSNTAYDWNDVDVKDKADPLYGSGTSTAVHPLADAGIYFHTTTFYTGLSATNLINTSSSASNYSQALHPHIFLSAGKSFSFANRMVLNPSLLVKVVDGITSVDLNCNLLFHERLWLGASFRFSYGYVFLLEYLVTDKLKIGYAYDGGINAIGRVGGATNEIMVGYNFSVFNKKMQSFRYL